MKGEKKIYLDSATARGVGEEAPWFEGEDDDDDDDDKDQHKEEECENDNAL